MSWKSGEEAKKKQNGQQHWTFKRHKIRTKKQYLNFNIKVTDDLNYFSHIVRKEAKLWRVMGK